MTARPSTPVDGSGGFGAFVSRARKGGPDPNWVLLTPVHRVFRHDGTPLPTFNGGEALHSEEDTAVISSGLAPVRNASTFGDVEPPVKLSGFYADDEALFNSIMAGAAGFVLKQIRGRDLVDAQRRPATNENVRLLNGPGSNAASIRNGVPGSEMGPVRVTDDEVWKLVAFVKRLGSQGLLERATGDPSAGRLVYEKSGCGNCHRIGPSLGPSSRARS